MSGGSVVPGSLFPEDITCEFSAVGEDSRRPAALVYAASDSDMNTFVRLVFVE